MATVITIANQKGGVGKTTTALAISDNLIKRGKRVLFVDADPQRNSSVVYQAKIDGAATLFDIFFTKDVSTKDCIQHTEYGDILASDDLLQDIDTKIPDDILKFKRLKRALASVDKDYDYVIIDTPPHMGVLLRNALMATHYVIVPVTCDSFAAQGLYDFYESVRMFQEDDNEDLKILGLLKIKYKPRQNITHAVDEDILPEIAKRMNTKVFNTPIRDSVKCQEAQMLNTPLYTYAKNCTSAIDYDKFVEEEIIGEGI